MAFFKKNKKNPKGQATLEYLLLIVVVIAIATGIGGPLGRYLANFSGSLLGPKGYYACLTEKGLLPGDQRADDCKGSVTLALKELENIEKGTGFGGGGSGGGGSGGDGPGGDGPGGDGPGGDGPGGDGPGGDGPGGDGPGGDGPGGDGPGGDGPGGDGPGGDGPGGDSSGGSGDKGKGSKDDKKNQNSKNSKNNKSSSNRHKVSSNLTENSLNSFSGGEGGLSGDKSNSSAYFSPFAVSSSSKKEEQKKGENQMGGRGLNLDEDGNEFGGGGNKGSKRTRFRARRGQGYLGDYIIEEEIEVEREKPVFKVVENSKKTRGFVGGNVNKRQIETNRKLAETAKKEEEIKGVDFSAFLKYLIIAILFILICALIFSQFMEYQSRE